MEEKQLTEKESLEVITSMIARTKQRYLGSGNILLMWGCLVTIVAIIVWILIASTRQNVWNWLWFAIPVIGWPATVVMARKEQHAHGAITYSDKITSRLWALFGVSEIILALACLGFYYIGGVNCWGAMLAYSILIAPCAEIAQGLVVKENSLIWGGLAGVLIGIITLCCIVGGVPLAVKWYMPLFIFAFVAMMIVPGWIINHKARRE